MQGRSGLPSQSLLLYFVGSVTIHINQVVNFRFLPSSMLMGTTRSEAHLMFILLELVGVIVVSKGNEMQRT